MLAGKKGANCTSPSSVSDQVMEAKDCLASKLHRSKEGSRALDAIRFIRISIASKALASLDPKRCAVLDAVFLRRLHLSNDAGLSPSQRTPRGSRRGAYVPEHSGDTQRMQQHVDGLGWSASEMACGRRRAGSIPSRGPEVRPSGTPRLISSLPRLR